MKLLKAEKTDATVGNLWKTIILYTFPLVLGTLIQISFNSIDLIVIGNMADSTAVAAVGATGPIISLIVNSFIGIVGGSKIILSHQFGSKNSELIKKTVDTSVITALGIGLLIAVLGMPFIPAFFRMTNCPAECFEGAVIYTRVYIASAPAILLYNFGSAVLTASGDSQRPLYYILISGMIKVVLNIVLCLILPQKVVAVSVTTALSQIIGAFLVLRRLCTMEGDGRLELRRLVFNFKAFKQIMLQGLPLALNTALYPFANLQIQSAINSFGVSAIAGNSASATIEGVPGAFSGAFGSTATVFMGQNLGAGKVDRVKKTFWRCMLISCSIGLILGVGMYLTGEFWLSLFLPDDPKGIEYGLIRMTYVLLIYAIACAKAVASAGLQSYGYAGYTALSSIIFVFGFRFIWMWFVYPRFETFDMLMACFTVSWICVLICDSLGYFLLCRGNKRAKI